MDKLIRVRLQVMAPSRLGWQQLVGEGAKAQAARMEG